NACYCPFRSIRGSSKRATRRDNDECWAKVSRHIQAIFHNGQCVIVATGEEMSVGNPGVAAPIERIEWAEALGAREMLDCHVRFAIKNPYPTTKEPSSRKIRIEHESPTDHGDAHVEVLGDACNYKSRDAQCCRIVLTQSCRKPRQSLGFERLHMA